jgi:hypothetical protein
VTVYTRAGRKYSRRAGESAKSWGKEGSQASFGCPLIRITRKVKILERLTETRAAEFQDYLNQCQIV